jgi:hypothetical protein
MRKLMIAAGAATAIASLGLLSSERAEALLASGAATVHSAAKQVDAVDAAHYRRCWRWHHRWHCHRHHHRFYRY